MQEEEVLGEEGPRGGHSGEVPVGVPEQQDHGGCCTAAAGSQHSGEAFATRHPPSPLTQNIADLGAPSAVSQVCLPTRRPDMSAAAPQPPASAAEAAASAAASAASTAASSFSAFASVGGAAVIPTGAVDRDAGWAKSPGEGAGFTGTGRDEGVAAAPALPQTGAGGANAPLTPNRWAGEGLGATICTRTRTLRFGGAGHAGLATAAGPAGPPTSDARQAAEETAGPANLLELLEAMVFSALSTPPPPRSCLDADRCVHCCA
jgi:hypothetical protein